MTKFVALLLPVFIPLALANPAYAGPLRDKLKERWVKKQSEKPAPEAQSDVTQKLIAGDYTFTISSQGMDRYYKIHIPVSYNAKNPTPLVFALHGGGGDMNIQSNEEYYHQISKSDEAGYIVAFPNGSSPFPSGKLATWNAGKCCGQARDKKIDDVKFFKDLINTISGQVNVDAQRIFAIGMSNGGMMSYRLACEMSDTFKAIASVAGTDNTVECKPKQNISVLHIHAKDDDHVKYDGGAGEKAFPDKSMVTEFTSVRGTIDKWKKQNGCEPTPVTILQVEGAKCERYLKCKGGVLVQLCTTDKGGHSWPGGKRPRAGAGGTPTAAIKANDVIWDFFKSLN